MANDVECPTCWSKGEEACVRGRAPSDMWLKQIPYPQGHDSRRTAQNKHDKKNAKEQK